MIVLEHQFSAELIIVFLRFCVLFFDFPSTSPPPFFFSLSLLLFILIFFSFLHSIEIFSERNVRITVIRLTFAHHMDLNCDLVF